MDNSLRPIYQLTRDYTYLTEDESKYSTFFLNLTINSLELFFFPFILIILIINYMNIRETLTQGISNYSKKLNTQQRNIFAITILLIGIILAMTIASSVSYRNPCI